MADLAALRPRLIALRGDVARRLIDGALAADFVQAALPRQRGA
jgi:hypothetical protein